MKFFNLKSLKFFFLKHIDNWKIILTVWLAIGIFVSGIFYIFPPKKNHKKLNFNEKVELIGKIRIAKEFYIDTEQTKIKIYNKKYYKFFSLVTLTGSVIIFGFGKYYKKNDAS